MFLTEAANRGSISTGYDIDYSISFDKNTNESLYRTPSSNGDQQKFTFSAWVKFSHVNTGVSDWSTLFSVGDFIISKSSIILFLSLKYFSDCQ